MRTRLTPPALYYMRVYYTIGEARTCCLAEYEADGLRLDGCFMHQDSS
jgi:hypothetical protein